MTTMETESTFNIFQILSAGDKELVHSSMLKFLLEKYPIFRKEFLGKEFEHNTQLYIKLEHSDKIEEETNEKGKVKLKRLRFDLLGYDKTEDGKLLFAIENKFKATPSVHQLKDYDKYFNNHQDFAKYLLVYNKKQIPSDVDDYCTKENWIIRSYFPLEDTHSIENLLKKIEDLDQNKQFIVSQYFEYLSKIHTELEEYLDKENFITYKRENRELHFRYLLHIQKLISIKHLDLYPNSNLEFATYNDGGKNILPSIDFRIDRGIKFKYQKIRAVSFGVDGDTIKTSVFYDRDNKVNKRELEQYLQEVKEKIKPDLDKLKNLKQIKEGGRNIKLKEFEGSTKISVFSLFTFKPIDGKLKQDVVNDCANLLNMYFKYFKPE